MYKRGQVTIFIILGIVILAVFGVLFFFRNELTTQDFQSELEKVKVTEQIKPAKDYIDSCIEDLTLRGVSIIAANGGYITVPKDPIPRSSINPFSNSLQLGNSEVAYWYYKSANNLDKTQVPTIDSMEIELENYVNDNFRYCLNELDFYVQEGFQIESSEFAITDVKIEDTFIEISVFSPVDIKLNEVGQYFDKQLVLVNTNLGKLYKDALEIHAKENQDLFLEEKTIDMMVVYEDIPFSDTTFDCGRLNWQKSEVENNFKEIVERNIPELRLQNADYTRTRNDNNYFEIDLNSKENVNVNFNYDSSWPLKIDVTPSNGELLSGDPVTQENPEIAKYLNLFFCMNNYHFVYDVKYPTLVSLTDENGLTFQYATMVVIDNNNPRQYTGEVFYYDDSGVLGEEFCRNTVNTLEVSTLDASDFTPVSNVDVSYSCISSNCYVGKTDSSGNLNSKFPACINGRVSGVKDGYYFTPVTISTDVDSKVNLFLDPYYNLDAEVRIVDMNTGRVRELEENEEVIVQLQNTDNGYITNVISSDDEIRLVAGYYKITSYLTEEANTPLTIRGQTYVECVNVPRSGLLGLVGLEREDCFESKTEDFEIEAFISGGANYEFEFDYGLLNGKSKVTFYVPYNKEPRTNQDMLDIFSNINVNSENDNFIYPGLE